jgi:carboxymethylenebutenolidase
MDGPRRSAEDDRMTKTKDTVTLDVAGSPSAMRCHVATPAADGPHGAVVVVHELFGVNDDIGGVLDDLAALGYVAVAPELYHRTAAAGAAFPRDEEGRAVGFEHLHHVTRQTALADVAAVLAYLGLREDTSGRTAMLGFSFGGHVAYLAATRFPLAATIVLYGGWLTSTDIALSQPEPTIRLTPAIAEHAGRVAFLVGEDDHVISADDRDAIETALASAGVRHEVVAYPGTQHAFFWEDTPAFNRASRDAAWGRITALLAESLAN